MILLLVGCTSFQVQDLVVTPGEIPTVLQVEWTTPEPSAGVVTASFGDDSVSAAATDYTTVHSVFLMGLPTSTDVTVRVDATTAEGASAVETVDGTIDPAPAWVPDFRFSSDVPDAGEGGYTVAPVILQDGGGTVVLDHLGRTVWAWPWSDTPEPRSAYRARLSLDGAAMLINFAAADVTAPGQIARIPLAGGPMTMVGIPSAHTDFVEYTPGGYLALGWEIREMEGRKILADTIVEVDPDGNTRVVYNPFDDFEPDLSMEYGHFYTADPDVEDWTHINGIAYDPGTDTVYVSATFNSGVLAVHRASGELLWCLSDQAGDFTNLSEGDLLALPHSVQPVDGGVLVFSRGNPGNPDACSAAVEVGLDEAAGTAERLWTYESETCLLVTYLGAAERLAGGNTLVTFSSSGQIDEVTPDGELAWRVGAPIGAAIGFAGRVERLGP